MNKEIRTAEEVLELHTGSDYYELQEFGFLKHIVAAVHEYHNQFKTEVSEGTVSKSAGEWLGKKYRHHEHEYKCSGIVCTHNGFWVTGINYGLPEGSNNHWHKIENIEWLDESPSLSPKEQSESQQSLWDNVIWICDRNKNKSLAEQIRSLSETYSIQKKLK